MITTAITGAITAWLLSAGVELQPWHPVAIWIAAKLFIVTPIVVPLSLYLRKKALALQAAEAAKTKATEPPPSP